LAPPRGAFAFLAAASWPVFTERARALLDARPNDPQVREALLKARDPRLRKLGQKAVAL